MTAPDPGPMHERRRTMLRSSALPTMRVNLTPMIDVVFLLLIYFVLIADFVEPERTTPYTPAAEGAASSDPFALPQVPEVLTVTTLDATASGYQVDDLTGVFRTSDTSTFGAIAARAYDQLGAARPIIVAPADDTAWEHVVAVYATLREAGFEALAIDTSGDSP